MDTQDFKSLNFTLLGANSNLEGDFKFFGDTIINCKVNGNLHMLNNSELILERESYFEGNIYAHNIEIFGEFKGAIHASGKVSIKSSGTISGKIQSQQLIIAPGAIVNIDGTTKEL